MIDFSTMPLSGWRPEPQHLAAQHWDFERVKAGMSVSSIGSDLRPFSPPTRHNQRITNSCVLQAMIRALEIKRIQKYGPAAHVPLSTLAPYYLSRELMTPSETSNDDGTFVSMAAEVIRRFGVCTEASWPFAEADGTALDRTNSRSHLYTPPTWGAMRGAYVHKISAWYRINSQGDARVQDVITALAAGNPVVYGTQIGAAWQDYQAGQVLGLPTSPKGRHATVLEGWDLALSVFNGENSWGDDWGDRGFYLASPEVIASPMSDDFVVMQGGWEDWAPAP